MFRKILIFSAVSAGFSAFGAQATERFADEGHDARITSSGEILLAQAGDVEVYFDGRGNRVLVDPDTGEVVAIQPPRRKMNRQAERRYLRERQLQRDRYYLDDPEDMARLRRDRAGTYENPIDDYDVSREPPSADDFPEAPRDTFADEPEPSVVRREPVRRAPLDEETAAAPTDELDRKPTGTTPEPDTAALTPETIIADPAVEPPLTFTAREEVAGVQVLMDRAGASPGVIDGKFGSNVDKAFAAYRRLTGTNLKSTDAAGIKAALAASGGDPFTTYTITPEDAAGPFVASIPADYSQKALLPGMSFTSVTEMLAEKFHMDETYLKALNPEANFSRPGTIVRVVNIGQPVAGAVARITADKAQKQVLAYDAYDKLIAAYPATIGSSDTPSPTGTHAISRIALNPNYTYNPKLNFKQGENDKVLTIPPGPNGPVGSVWIALDKPTYGIHGTPDPSKIGKTESHGCVRLTNWDAAELAKIVSPGVTVEFLE